MSIRFDGRVAIVTGAGIGLGRAHALGLAERGAKVVINDLGAATDGTGASSAAAEAVVEEIRAAGGEAIAHGANVADMAQVEDMVAKTMEKWGRVDILVNNAGILRDKSFSKMTLEDFRSVLEVHLMGSVNTTKALWDQFRAQEYGRIVFTTSSSGMFGNFGQANYGAAKSGMLGLMNVLHQEGAKYNIRVNMLSPTAATRMTEELLPPESLVLMRPESITPGLLTLVCEEAPSKMIMGAGAGCFAEIKIHETIGVSLPDEELTPEDVMAAMDRIRDTSGQREMPGAFDQTSKYVRMAAETRGVKLS